MIVTEMPKQRGSVNERSKAAPSRGGARRSSVRRVILYIGSDPKRDGSMFFLNLFWSLMTLGQQAKVEMLPVIDMRPPAQGLLPPPEIASIRAEGEVDGIISFMVFPGMTEWMRESGLPWVALCEGKNESFVGFDYVKMVRDALARLVELGCKTGGLIIPAAFTDAAFLEQVDAIAGSVGINVNYEWILASRDSQELSGYAHLNALWELGSRPEGLVVFPDLAARGVVSAILEKRIKVPKELRLILHRNAESPYVVPMPCDWLEANVGDVATALLTRLEERCAGIPKDRKSLSFRLIKAS